MRATHPGADGGGGGPGGPDPPFLTSPSFEIFSAVYFLNGFPSFYNMLNLDPPSNFFLDLPLLTSMLTLSKSLTKSLPTCH